LKDALNTIWNVEPRKTGGVMAFIKERFLSLAMVLGIGFLLLVSLIFDVIISAMGDYLGRFIGGEAVLHILELLISFGLSTVLFACIFRFLPDLRIAWRDVWLGSVFTSLLFVLGKWGLGLYLGKAAIGSSYGAAGSLVILLVWVYWSAQILFFGAEFAQVYARAYGSLKGDRSKEQARASAERIEDRPRTVVARPVTVTPMYTRSNSSGGFGKVAAGGAAGLLFGAILGALSTFVLVIRSAKKVLLPFK
jgi:membrane protein